MTLRWQYPSLTEPVSQEGENITLDKWYQPLSSPVKQKVLSTALAFTVATLVEFSIPSALPILEWMQPFSQPLPIQQIVQTGGGKVVEFVGEGLPTNGTFDFNSYWTLGDGWALTNNKATSDGTQVSTSALDSTDNYSEYTEGVLYRITITMLERSAGSVSIYLRGQFTASLSTPYAIYNLDVVCGSGTADSLRLLASADFVGSVDSVSVSVFPLLDRWQQPLSLPVIAAKRTQPQGFSLVDFTVPGPLAIDWFTPINQPLPVINRSKGPHLVLVDIATTVLPLFNDWVQPTQQPVVVPQRNESFPSLAFTEVVTPPVFVDMDRWYSPIVQPLFSKVKLGTQIPSVSFVNLETTAPTGIGIIYSAEAVIISSYYTVDIIDNYHTTAISDDYHTTKIV